MVTHANNYREIPSGASIALLEGSAFGIIGMLQDGFALWKDGKHEEKSVADPRIPAHFRFGHVRLRQVR
jgi:hypothetical protein